MKTTMSQGEHWDSVNIKLADPAFVLRAVNCHADLLEACKMLIEQTAAGDWGCPPVLKARAAIAKAEGTEKEGAK